MTADISGTVENAYSPIDYTPSGIVSPPLVTNSRRPSTASTKILLGSIPSNVDVYLALSGSTVIVES